VASLDILSVKQAEEKIHIITEDSSKPGMYLVITAVRIPITAKS
jgi:hypothetical protein